MSYESLLVVLYQKTDESSTNIFLIKSKIIWVFFWRQIQKGSAVQSKNAVCAFIRNNRYFHTVTPSDFFPVALKRRKNYAKTFQVIISSSFALILTQKPWGSTFRGVRVTRQSQGVGGSLRPSVYFQWKMLKIHFLLLLKANACNICTFFLFIWIRNMSSFIFPPNLAT